MPISPTMSCATTEQHLHPSSRGANTGAFQHDACAIALPVCWRMVASEIMEKDISYSLETREQFESGQYTKAVWRMTHI